MTITTLQEHLDYLEIQPDDTNGIDAITLIHPACEEYVSSYCNQSFESTNYKLERHSGLGNKIIKLKHYPVISVDRVAINTVDVIKVKNLNANIPSSISVNSTGIRLLYNGTANSTVLFATYTTISAVVAAINLINGWSAELTSSNFTSRKSTDLIPVFGINTEDNQVYLYVVDEALDSLDVDIDTAQLYRVGGWPEGTRNIYVDYTAGYSSVDMPEGLKHAVKMLVQYSYKMTREENLIGIDEYFTGKFRTILSQTKLPRQVVNALDKYKRVLL